MITKGLTNNDLRRLEMDLDELKRCRDDILQELHELEIVLKAVNDDPELLLRKTSYIIDPYVRKWKPDGF